MIFEFIKKVVLNAKYNFFKVVLFSSLCQFAEKIEIPTISIDKEFSP